MKTDEEITEFFKNLYGGPDTIQITRNDMLEVLVGDMYQFVPVDFKYLVKIGEFFNTDKINLTKEANEGCETCNYGSSYEITFYIDLN